jgi:hypothetical protein
MDDWSFDNRDKQIQMKLKQEPKLIYYSLTHEFTLEREDGSEIGIRKYEDSKGGGLLKWDKNQMDWVEVYDKVLMLEIEDAIEDFDFFKLY